MSLTTETGKQSFYQWDTNQILIVEGAPECRQVHFGYRDGSGAKVCNIREMDGKRVVDVPNELLQKDRTFFAYLIGQENDGTQIPAQSFLVLMRPKPDDYVYTETEVQTYEALEERIAELEVNGGSGVSCTHEWDGTVLTVTSASGTSSADLKGEKGEPGPAGADYVLTDADKTEIAEEAAALVPGGEIAGELLYEKEFESVSQITEEIDWKGHTRLVITVGGDKADAAISLQQGMLTFAAGSSFVFAYYTSFLQATSASYPQGGCAHNFNQLNSDTALIEYYTDNTKRTCTDASFQGSSSLVQAVKKKLVAAASLDATVDSISMKFSNTVSNCLVRIWGY